MMRPFSVWHGDCKKKIRGIKILYGFGWWEIAWIGVMIKIIEGFLDIK